MGMSGTYLHWGEPFLERLRESFEVIVYDHRGVGASSRLEGPVTISQLAADAAGLVRALELDSVHVLGISMGGMVAQELVLAEPELVRTLDARVHLLRRARQFIRLGRGRAAGRGDGLRRPRPGPAGGV